MNKKQHWENVFATKKETEVSWFQSKPETSINFFTKNNIPKTARIIDIGGGDSYLIDNLIDLGYTNLYLLDISANAIERIKNRLGTNATKVTFIVSDVIDFEPNTIFDVWHDRACFHFLTNDKDVLKYQNLVSNNITNNGFLFIGTFSEDGPIKCSGQEITQYNDKKLSNIFNLDFEKINCFIENHQTPFDTLQNFIFCTFLKKS